MIIKPRKKAHEKLAKKHSWRAFRVASLGVLSWAAIFLVGCASTQMAPQFRAPSTVPIQQAHEKVQKAQKETKSHITKAQEIVRTIHLSLPEDQTKIDALTNELTEAQTSLSTAEQALAESEGARASLTEQVGQLTKDCNTVATNYNKVKPELVSVTHKYHRDKFILTGLLAAAGGFIAWKLKPLLALAGPYGWLAGIVGLPALFGLLGIFIL